MEDTLGVTLGGHQLPMNCLNPCSNGRYSRSNMKKKQGKALVSS